MDVLSEANVAQDLSDIIEAYLLAQGCRKMKGAKRKFAPGKGESAGSSTSIYVQMARRENREEARTSLSSL